MKTVAKWTCSLLSCICCCFCVAGVGGTLGTASLRHSRVGRFLYILLLVGVSFLAWMFFNMPAWIDSAHYLTILPNFRGCNASSSLHEVQGGGDTRGPNSNVLASDKTLIQWLLEHEFGERVLTVPQRLCYGALSAYRVFFALSLLYLVLSVLMLGARHERKSLRYEIQHGWWVIKLGILGLLLVLAFLVLSDYVMLIYSWIAFVGGIVWMFIQIVLLIEFAHNTSRRIASAATPAITTREDSLSDDLTPDPQPASSVSCLIAGTGAAFIVLVAYVGTFVFLSMAYASVPCAPVITGTTITLLLTLIVSFLGFLAQKTNRGGLAPASIACLSAAYLTWSAFSPMALESMHCITESAALNALTGSNTTLSRVVHFATLHDLSTDAQHIILIGTAIVALAYTTVRTAETSERVQATSRTRLDDTEVPMPVSRQSGMYLDSDEENGVDAPVQPEAPYNYSWFHFTLFLATLYAAMVLTGWNQLSSVAHAVDFANETSTSAWIKLGAAWTTLVLYCWTVFVPFVRTYCCRQRP